MNENNLLKVLMCLSIFGIFGLPNLILGQDVIFESQADVDSFDPSIEVINGNLSIGFDEDVINDIVDLSNLENLTRITGDLSIESTLLENLDDLSILAVIGNQLSINRNPLLTQLDGLSNVTSQIRNLRILSNSELLNIDGLTGVSSISNQLSFISNDKLMNVTGLSGLGAIGAELFLVNNGSLVNIDGLSNLESLGSLSISSNSSLEHISGLSKITELYNLSISSNDNLKTLDGLENIASIENHFLVRFNELLMNCCAIQNLFSDPIAIGGTIIVQGNPSECSSVQDIVDASCLVNVDEVSTIEWNITPNVITTERSIQIKSDTDLQNAQVYILSENGQVISSQILTSEYIKINEDISQGLYFLSISIDGKKNTKKLIVSH